MKIIILILTIILSGCSNQTKKHYIINGNDTIASLIEKNDSSLVAKINIYEYDFKDKKTNSRIIEQFDLQEFNYICIKNHFKEGKYISGRYENEPNGFKTIITGRLDTIAHLTFNHYKVGAFVKTPHIIKETNQLQKIMKMFNLKECNFYVMRGTGISNMNIYSLAKLTHNDVFSNNVFINQDNKSYNTFNTPDKGLKNFSCTLDYLYYILTNAILLEFTEEEDALYYSIAIRDIGEFAIKCMMSSENEIYDKASLLIETLKKSQSDFLEIIRTNYFLYYKNNYRKYELKDVRMTKNDQRNKYTLILESDRFISKDYCLHVVVNNRDNIIGYAGFNNIVLIGPNGSYSFPIYGGKGLKPNEIGWPDNYEQEKRKDITSILKNIEKFYNPF